MPREPIRFVVKGNPPSKNDWHVIVPANSVRNAKKSNVPYRRLSERAKAFIDDVTILWRQMHESTIDWGEWALSVTMHVGRRMKIGEEYFPMRDVDSAISPVMDALQRAGVIDNDVRICLVRLDRAYDKTRPRTEVVLRPVTFEDDYSSSS